MTTLDKLPEILTIAEVAGILRVSKLTVKRMGKRGDIKFFRVNKRGDRRFNREDIINLIK